MRFVRRAVRDLLPGDHAWLPYSSDAEQGHVVGAWVEQGLRIRDKVIYVTDAEAWELPGLFGQDLGPAVRAGLLTLVPIGDACLSSGMFDPGKMLETVGDEIKKAEEQQFRGIRFTADMSWVFGEPFGDARLDSCEHHFGEKVAPSMSVTAICQTDIRKCDTDQYEMLDRHHEVRVVPDPDFDDPVLSITRTYQPLGLQIKGDLDVARKQHFADALHGVTSNGEAVHLDLGDVDFLSLDGLYVMADYTRRRGPSSRVVLDHMPASVRSMIDVVGLARLPGIQIGEDS